MEYIKKYENFDVYDYRRKEVIKFLNDVKIHILPENLRLVNNSKSYRTYKDKDKNINSYDIAIKQAEDFLSGDMSYDELIEPDNILRNIMLLWGIDKQKCKKRTPDFYSVGKVKNMEWRDGIYCGYIEGWTAYVLKEPTTNIPEKYISKFKVKGRSRKDGESQCVIEIIEQKGYVVHRLPISDAPGQGNQVVGCDLKHPAWLGADWQTDARQIEKIIKGIEPFPDWLVVDHYALDERWEGYLRPYVKKIMVIDDLADRPHACDLLLDQNLPGKSLDLQNR